VTDDARDTPQGVPRAPSPVNEDATTIGREGALELWAQMLRIRRFEEKCAELYQAEKIRGFLHLYIGEEAVAAGVMPALGPEDSVVSTYREHGHALARGVSMKAVLAEMYGKREGCSGGRGGSMHLFDVKKRFFGGNAIVGGGLPLAVGLALADKMQERSAVTACFFGDGAAAEGVFHESMNLAALWKLPVLFVCENNLYAMGTALARYEAQIDLCFKAQSYRVSADPVDGMDVLAVRAAARRAVAEIRGGGGPRFLELRTYRFRAHSMFDPELYRSKGEVELWRRRDPLDGFPAELRALRLLQDTDHERLERDVAAEVTEAVAFAEAGTFEPVETLTRHTYAEARR
jgi:pyruvate dehydrogenase E1 component alpha subunit